MEIIRVKDYETMSKKASEIVADRVKTLENPILGLATGSTPEGMYRYLIEKYQAGEVSFKSAKSFNLDEYIGLSADDKNSYNYYMFDKFFNHVDILKENVNLPNGTATDLKQACLDYDQKIKDAGGIDIQVLGIGVNGHIGFNEPGTPFTMRTHVVDLTESTRQANSIYFPSLDEVPTQAFTMGIGTIMESKEIILLAYGESKANAIAKMLKGEVTEDLPASILKNHPNVTVIADEKALSLV